MELRVCADQEIRKDALPGSDGRAAIGTGDRLSLSAGSAC
jgi:hypothetical protein